LREKLWNDIPEFHIEIQKTDEDRFQMLQGENQIHSKINNMLATADSKFLILGSEKDLLKFYHGNFLELLGQSNLEFKILTSSTNKTMYIFDELDKKNVKKLPSTINSNLCYLLKDDDELLFYLKNAENTNEELTAMWTNSKSMIHSNKLLFESILYKSKNISL